MAKSLEWANAILGYIRTDGAPSGSAEIAQIWCGLIKTAVPANLSASSAVYGNEANYTNYARENLAGLLEAPSATVPGEMRNSGTFEFETVGTTGNTIVGVFIVNTGTLAAGYIPRYTSISNLTLSNLDIPRVSAGSLIVYEK